MLACEKCKYPMHEQYERYPGHWYCFRPGETCGKTICATPVEDWNDFRANNCSLKEAKTPKWCPGAVEGK